MLESKFETSADKELQFNEVAGPVSCPIYLGIVHYFNIKLLGLFGLAEPVQRSHGHSVAFMRR